ncbi:PLP-dependent transferase [Trametes versicolor FP-101664 SS1]|uniref:PLP-dependent transferase n=1 Tax=Trametes versicolor (strain FP-101664) TaxID=717944 RepID=UPI0004623424|nr:PLP-dependent transferase [Trametes versicolor FP-101664 SS1]EIW56993.1 PLP-dependent transferase [Trametes versicolor FP-101664 SS1]
MSLGLVFCSRNVARTLARTPALQHHVWHSRLLSASSHTLGQQIPTTTLAEKESTKSFAIASRLRDGRALALDVWSVFNAANLPPDCINLGQGYMNFAPPPWAREAAEQALRSVEGNHYSPPKGRPRLRKALKEFYSPQFGRELDPESEIVVTSGANEGQYAAWTAFLEQGDEVIIFEPFFDQYLPSIVFNGGKPVYVPLHPSTERAPGAKFGKKTWNIDFDELKRAITPRTKMIVLNTPHNPAGKVFTRDELEHVAQLAEAHDLIVMSDEVYESLVFDGREHVRFATLPGMWERTITVGSAGKLFAATGWRVGWLIGPPALIGPTSAATTRIVFCTNSPMQEAAAAGFEQARERGFFETQLREYTERRAVLVDAFERLGLEYAWPEGSYFVLLNISRVRWPEYYTFPATLKGRGRDFKAAWFIANEVGVSSIPVSEFYCEEHVSIGENYARFAFCKDLDTLRRAAERLQRLRDFLV